MFVGGKDFLTPLTELSKLKVSFNSRVNLLLKDFRLYYYIYVKFGDGLIELLSY